MSLSKPQSIRPQNGGSALMGALDRMNRAEETTAAGLHERYLDDVFRYVLRRVLRVEEAEDITAEVFAAAVAGLPRFRSQCPPYLWLLSIARRQIARARRRQVVRRETLATELADEARDAASIWEALAVVGGPGTALMRGEASRGLSGVVARPSPD